MSSNDPLEIALRELESLEQLGIAALVAASSPEALETARIEYLGQKQGKLKAAQERLRTLDPAGKRVYGQRFNGVKQSLEAALSAGRSYVLKAARGDYGSEGRPARFAIDVTLPGAIPRL
ncbi:MAG: phenylalanine--tRNA ligase subunit alpha, partial [Isosphaeraceae bacterium]